jgi:hypothetical protein
LGSKARAVGQGQTEKKLNLSELERREEVENSAELKAGKAEQVGKLIVAEGV